MGLGEHATEPVGFVCDKEKKLLSSWGGFLSNAPTLAGENGCSNYTVAARGGSPEQDCHRSGRGQAGVSCWE